MKNKGYNAETKFLQVVRNWRRTVDDRGLSDEQRHTFNMDLMEYILDDLMPWHRDNLDYSLLG